MKDRSLNTHTGLGSLEHGDTHANAVLAAVVFVIDIYQRLHDPRPGLHPRVDGEPDLHDLSGRCLDDAAPQLHELRVGGVQEEAPRAGVPAVQKELRS